MVTFIQQKELSTCVQTFSSVPPVLGRLSKKKHLAFFQYSNSLINVSSENNTPARCRQPYWTQTLNLKQQAWHWATGSLVMPLRICSCAVEGQNLLPPQLLFVHALRSIKHDTWQNDKIRKLFSDSRGFPFNPTKQGWPWPSSRNVHYTWEPDIYRHFSHSKLVEQLENK